MRGCAIRDNSCPSRLTPSRLSLALLAGCARFFSPWLSRALSLSLARSLRDSDNSATRETKGEHETSALDVGNEANASGSSAGFSSAGRLFRPVFPDRSTGRCAKLAEASKISHHKAKTRSSPSGSTKQILNNIGVFAISSAMRRDKLPRSAARIIIYRPSRRH